MHKVWIHKAHGFRRRATLLLVGLFWACTGSAVEAVEWQDLGLYGGQILSLAVDPGLPGVLYAGSWSGDGLFKSVDGARTWQTVSSGGTAWFRNLEIFDIAVDPSDSSVVWVANGQFLDVSRDSGQTWKAFGFAVPEGRFCYAVAVDPHDPGGRTIYAGTGGPAGISRSGAVFKTTDSGETWFKAKADTPSDVLDIHVSPERPGEVWAVSAPWTEDEGQVGRVICSVDSGRTWRQWPLADGPDGQPRLFGYLDEVLSGAQAGGGAVVCGRDGAALGSAGRQQPPEWSWTILAPGSVSRAMCMPPSAPGRLYVGLDETILKSSDGGLSWGGPLAAPSLLCLKADPQNEEILYGGGISRGIFKSSDGALTWQPHNQGIRANAVYSVDIFPGRCETLLCGTQAGVYFSDNGTEWQLINDRTASAVCFHPESDQVIYAGFDRQLGRSTNGGRTWEYLNASGRPETHDVPAVAVVPGSSGRVYAGVRFFAGNRGEVLRITENNGDFSKSQADTVLTTPVPVSALAVHPDRPDVVLAGTGWFFAPGIPGTIYVSLDGGESWTRSGLGPAVVNDIAVVPGHPGIIYAGCGESGGRYGGIFVSRDSGMTWEKQTGGLPSEVSVTGIHVDGVDSLTAYAAVYDPETNAGAGEGGIYMTRDGGRYWTRLGLSDDELFAVSGCQSPSAAGVSEKRPGRAGNRAADAGMIFAGTSFGLYRSSTAGAGIVTGMIVDGENGLPIDGATVLSGAGAACRSAEGVYLLMVPEGTHLVRVQAQGYEQVSAASVTVAAGQAATRDFQLARAPEGDPCPAGALLEGPGRQGRLERLRSFRDGVLERTAAGKRLVRLYYRLALDVMRVLEEDAELREKGREMLLSGLAFLGGAEAGPIPPAMYRRADSFLSALAWAAPAHLGKEISRARKQLKLWMIEGNRG